MCKNFVICNEHGPKQSLAKSLFKNSNSGTNLDVREETHPLTAKEKLEQANLRTNIEKLTLLEEISWKQKSRVLHMREGDANTRFFHRMANSNRRNNGIESYG